MSLSENERSQIRRRLLQKGQAVANKLADVLAGADVRLSDLSLVQGVPDSVRAEDRLRAYLKHLNTRRNLLDTDVETFQRCVRCGAALSAVSLLDTPWADTCQECGGKESL